MKRIEKFKVFALALLIVLGSLAHHGSGVAGTDGGNDYRSAISVSDPGANALISETHKLYRAGCRNGAGTHDFWGDVTAFFDV